MGLVEHPINVSVEKALSLVKSSAVPLQQLQDVRRPCSSFIERGRHSAILSA
jgi:hypothetical protein